MNEEDTELIDAAKTHGVPLYVYHRKALKDRAKDLSNLSLPYGFVPRYAAKANMNPEIVGLFDAAGLQFDASSSYEAMKLVGYGIEPSKISLSSQELAHNLNELLELGVRFVATSMHQLESFCAANTSRCEVGLRVNPGYGSGGNNRTNTGGVNSSFGLWHEYLPDALELASNANVRVTRLHIHYGSGADPSIWSQVIETSLGIVAQMPDVISLDLGGGFKVSRFDSEVEANLVDIAQIFSQKLEQFAQETGREISLEIEPGTWLVAHSGVLLAAVTDIVDTGANGHTFLRLNTGMNDLIRPSMYGAQHKIKVLNNTNGKKSYVVVGHNCETGDILTPAKGDPEGISERPLNEAAIGDLVAIYDTGAYGRYFSVSGYNSFPSAKEVLV